MWLLSHIIGFLWERLGVQCPYIIGVTVATLRLMPYLGAYLILVLFYKIGGIFTRVGQKAARFRKLLFGYKAIRKNGGIDDKTLDQLR